MYLFTSQAGGAVNMVRYNEQLKQRGGSVDYGAQDVVKTFTSAEWTAIIALNVGGAGNVVTISETAPFPQVAGEK